MRQAVGTWIRVCAAIGFLGAIGPTIAVSAQSVPAPWTAGDIGKPSPAGTTTYDGQRFTISAGGSDIGGSADQFRFVYQKISGDTQIVARIDSFSAASSSSKVGVMIRGDLTTSAANAFVLLSGGNTLAFQSRPQARSSTRSTAGGNATAPLWLRLTRVGTTITSYSSPDGGTWQKIGSTTLSIGSSAYVGLAITSHRQGSAALAVLSQVTVGSPSTALPSNLSTSDIGSPAIAGSASYSQGTYTITGAGNDIWNTSDQFRYVYQQISGDADIVAHVASLQAIDPWSKGGVMIRETLDPGARHAMALISATQGYSFQWRLDPNGLASFVGGGSGAAPGWVRLTRTGSTFQAYRSTDGTTWTSMGSEVVPMTDPVYIGLAVTSHNASAATTATFDQVTMVQSSQPANQNPTVSLTSPTSGAQFTAPASVTISAIASDPENRLGRVDFFANSTKIGSAATAPFTMTWTNVASGTYSITATAYDLNGGSATSSPATIVVNPPAGTTTPPTTVIFQKSVDDATLVTSYRLDVFSNGADPNVATAVATSDLGKPTPDASGVITVDRTAFFAALAPATYVATVSAVGQGGIGRSNAVTFTR